MKIVKSRRKQVTVTVPVRGGFIAKFLEGRAVLPDDVADTLVGMASDFYSIAGTVASAIVGANVLVIRDMGLGDVFLITPLLRRLMTTQGAAAVDVLTLQRYRCIFDGNPYVRHTFALDGTLPDQSAYDVVIDLRLVVENQEARGMNRHRVDAFAEYADIAIDGSNPDERQLDYLVTPSEAHDAAAMLAPLRTACPRGVIGYVWKSTTSNRNWSTGYGGQHSKVITALIQAGYGVVVIDPESLGVAAACALDPFSADALLDLTGMLTIRESIAILDACDAVIAPDTGLFHAAGAIDKPTVAYFGPFPAAERHAHRNLTVLNVPSACGQLSELGGCRSYQCFNRDEMGQPLCLAVDPAAVVAAVEGLLNKDNKETSHAPVVAGPAAERETATVAEERERTRGEGAGLDRCDAAAGNPGQHPAEAGQARGGAGGAGRESDARPLLQLQGAAGIQ